MAWELVLRNPQIFFELAVSPNNVSLVQNDDVVQPLLGAKLRMMGQANLPGHHGSIFVVIHISIS